MVFFGALHLESLTGFTRDVCYFGVDKAFSGLWRAIGHQRAACMQHVTRAVAEHKTNRTKKTPPSSPVITSSSTWSHIDSFRERLSESWFFIYLQFYSHGQQQHSVYIASMAAPKRAWHDLQTAWHNHWYASRL